jgi:hypothetical protein
MSQLLSGNSEHQLLKLLSALEDINKLPTLLQRAAAVPHVMLSLLRSRANPG